MYFIKKEAVVGDYNDWGKTDVLIISTYFFAMSAKVSIWRTQVSMLVYKHAGVRLSHHKFHHFILQSAPQGCA